ncbi:hypothetical protein HZS_2802 [Henneguya salminicola]|nr:hypothetical protein HZS_2802 [Henneguya salminicola]
MKKDGMPDDEARNALNMMRSLPCIEDDQINEKLQKIQNLKGFTHQNLPQFWEYFSRIWLENYPPGLWKNKRKLENINSCTNNCLEQYNRRLPERINV